MNKKIALVVLGTLAGSTLAHAGIKNSFPVNVSSASAWGSAGSARNSLDSSQFISCNVQAWGGPAFMYCAARDAVGNYRSCSSSSAGIVAVAAAVSSDSYIYFTFDASGTCTGLSVDNNSTAEPKKP
jgi:hypothetical protein